MKKIFIFIGIFLFGLCAVAENVGVLPISVSKSNAYNLENTSDIIASEVISAGKIFTLNKPTQEVKLKNFMPDKKHALNLNLIKNLSAYDKTLVVTSFVPDKNGKLYDAWDILKISTDFGIETPYTMEIRTVLIDNKEGVILWQKTFEEPLGVFKAQNIAEALDKKEKIISYSRNIIAQDIVQNINLRLNPKNIDYSKRIPQTTGAQDGIGLKYKNNAPVVKITPADDKSFEERWRNDDSFNL